MYKHVVIVHILSFYINTQQPLSFQIKKFFFILKIQQKYPVQNFRWFEGTFMLAPFNFLKTTQKQIICDLKNLKFKKLLKSDKKYIKLKSPFIKFSSILFICVQCVFCDNCHIWKIILLRTLSLYFLGPLQFALVLFSENQLVP